MHGNFDQLQQLDGTGGVTVTGWICWAGVPQEPDSCTVTVEIKQSSGPGNSEADGTSAPYARPGKDGEHVEWTAQATCQRGILEPGPADARGWVKDSQGHTVFHWPASQPVTLV